MTSREKQPEVEALETRDAAIVAARAASDKKATDIVVLDVGDQLVITEYFVVCTASNERLVKTIADEVEQRVEETGYLLRGREGERGAEWVLLDFGDVVVHVFQPAAREYYRIERLMEEASVVELPEDVVALEDGRSGTGS